MKAIGIIISSFVLVSFQLLAERIDNTIYHQSNVNTNRSKTTLPKDAKKLAEYYRQRVIRGESMSSIAQLYSEDKGSAGNGGQYRNVVPGMMVPEFDKVAFSLKPGEISEVFETQFGFHFIQLISRKGDVLDLRHVLITKE